MTLYIVHANQGMATITNISRVSITVMAYVNHIYTFVRCADSPRDGAAQTRSACNPHLLYETEPGCASTAPRVPVMQAVTGV